MGTFQDRQKKRVAESKEPTAEEDTEPQVEESGDTSEATEDSG